MTARPGGGGTIVSGGANFGANFAPRVAEVRFAGSGSQRTFGQVGGRAIVAFAEFEVTQAAAANELYLRFNGAGNLSVYARGNLTSQYNFAGVGNLQVNVSLNQTAAARFNGSGSMQVLGQLAEAAYVRFNGAGNFSADSAKAARDVAVQFNGTGNLRVLVQQNM